MSELKARLQSDLTAAMKAREELVVSTLRLVLSAVTTAEVAGDTAVELNDEQVMATLRSEAKKRSEAAEIYAANDRAESAAKERAELAVIERYLPAGASDAEIATVVAEEVASAAAGGHEGPRAMGVVVKAVRARLGDRADGGRVAAAVKAALG